MLVWSRCITDSGHCSHVVTAFPESNNCYANAAAATAMLLLLLTHRILLQLRATIELSLLRVPGDTARLKLLLLTSFAAVATAIAYADPSVVRVALLTVFKLICCCYRNCYDANCYYEPGYRYCAYQETLLR